MSQENKETPISNIQKIFCEKDQGFNREERSEGGKYGRKGGGREGNENEN